MKKLIAVFALFLLSLGACGVDTPSTINSTTYALSSCRWVGQLAGRAWIESAGQPPENRYFLGDSCGPSEYSEVRSWSNAQVQQHVWQFICETAGSNPSYSLYDEVSGKWATLYMGVAVNTMYTTYDYGDRRLYKLETGAYSGSVKFKVQGTLPPWIPGRYITNGLLYNTYYYCEEPPTAMALSMSYSNGVRKNVSFYLWEM